MSIEAILEAMLQDMPEEIDKRTGSVIGVAVAPIAAQLSEQRFYADQIMDSTMADTALGNDLTRKCSEYGVNRYPSSPSLRKAIFTHADETPQEVEIGSRFGAEGIVYNVVGRVDEGIYQLECEQNGNLGNQYFGAILPVNNSYIGAATLGEVLIPGEDTESDEELRTRYYIAINSQPFGGNIAQYERQILAIPGVGDVKIFPTPDGVGGKVHCVIVAPENLPASTTLIKKVQEIINPEPSGKGYGLAPIGHDTTIGTVSTRSVSVETTVFLQSSYELETLKPLLQAAVQGYLEGLAFRDNTVRVAKVEAAILGVSGIKDIAETKVNGTMQNLILSARWDNYEVPVLEILDVKEGQ